MHQSFEARLATVYLDRRKVLHLGMIFLSPPEGGLDLVTNRQGAN